MGFKVTLVVNPAILNKDLPGNIAATGVESAMYQKVKDEEELLSMCQDADYIITHQGFFPFTPKVFRGLPKCRFVHTLSIGYDAFDVGVATEQGIGIVNMRGFSSEELAEHAMALMLALARGVVTLNNRVKGGVTMPLVSFEAGQNMTILKGKTLGLIGFGNAGRGLVPKAKGFEMRILAIDPYIDDDTFRKFDTEKVGLDRLLAESDFISIHSNLTPENRHLLGLEQFKKMKPTACIINTARGGIINELELCTALAEGYIAGAGLDVNDPEPITADSPLMKMDNVILTGHHAGNSRESNAALATLPVKEVERVRRGEWPFGLVNPAIKEKFVAKWGEMRDPTDV